VKGKRALLNVGCLPRSAEANACSGHPAEQISGRAELLDFWVDERYTIHLVALSRCMRSYIGVLCERRGIRWSLKEAV
jgi:hypothetical protein